MLFEDLRCFLEPHKAEDVWLSVIEQSDEVVDKTRELIPSDTPVPAQHPRCPPAKLSRSSFLGDLAKFESLGEFEVGPDTRLAYLGSCPRLIPESSQGGKEAQGVVLFRGGEKVEIVGDLRRSRPSGLVHGQDRLSHCSRWPVGTDRGCRPGQEHQGLWRI